MNWITRQQLAPSVWPDLAKLCNFGKNLKSLSKELNIYQVFGKRFNLLGPILYDFGHSFIVQKGQNLIKPFEYLFPLGPIPIKSYFSLPTLVIFMRLTWMGMKVGR